MNQYGLLTVEEMLDGNFVEVAPNITVSEGRIAAAKNQSALMVVKNNQLVGIVLYNKLFKTEFDPDTSISEVMRTDFTILEHDSLADDIMTYLPELRYHPLVVMGENNTILGLLVFDGLFARLAWQLKVTQARLEAVLNTVDEAVCIIDENDTVVNWNPRAETLYNIKAGNILNHNIEEYFSNLMVTKVIKEHQGVRSVYHQPCRDTHVLISASPVKIGGQVVGGVSVERDITEVVQLNKELNHASSQVKELRSEINRITGGRNPFARIKGHHHKLSELINMAKKVARTSAAVLIRGESGTGKELFARAIHDASDRADKPFVVVNCAAIPPTLFESEVFGYEGGAFTGADRRGKAGYFENANGGTLFLDEVAELPPDLQVKLLRVLQDKKFYRVGGSTPIEVDVRIIAATHRNLEEMLSKELFREDLYYRLNVVTLEVPPLRERRDDIPELVYQFTQEYSQLYGKHISRLEPEVMALLLAYPWPGNVREMKNVIERMVILAEDDVITEECVPAALKQQGKHQLPYQSGLVSVTEQTERELILRTLEQTNGNRSQAARMLGIPRSTLYYKMHQLGLI
ncbi:PAS domain S-box-containing protein [Desulfohalotomaculum tongense]|uniref:sigma 54-interacting transcriptional regulator n=1 Tax=Desulforadius tongensis TaxID=1216062 RepID=UPI00195D1A61|nr:sigma 54-interacting transcriptional regulator [Desulforadius tongensis]MBM7854723.1 PAS domain S-box-containing protein [Desulforadius tongensis]